MIKKVMLALLATCMAVVLLPTADATAATTKGRKVSCYGIKKSGRYAYVRVAIEGQVTPGYVNGYGNVSVSTACPRTNAIPITRMHIYHLQIRTNHGTVLKQTSHGKSTGSSQVFQKTPKRATKAGSGIRIWIQVGYKYYDGSYVRPFWIEGPVFTRGG